MIATGSAATTSTRITILGPICRWIATRRHHMPWSHHRWELSSRYRWLVACIIGTRGARRNVAPTFCHPASAIPRCAKVQDRRLPVVFGWFRPRVRSMAFSSCPHVSSAHSPRTRFLGGTPLANEPTLATSTGSILSWRTAEATCVETDELLPPEPSTDKSQFSQQPNGRNRNLRSPPPYPGTTKPRYHKTPVPQNPGTTKPTFSPNDAPLTTVS